MLTRLLWGQPKVREGMIKILHLLVYTSVIPLLLWRERASSFIMVGVYTRVGPLESLLRMQCYVSVGNIHRYEGGV